ncbi:uncharacterized protein BT62DRAFT_1004754 [Guyanagaster necrorhizus]|uniref:Uncharacterized protein n=1 Tax=Guyanagaster necrorhizus TaxID=856835 RepID=A0A9P7VVF3_9AGAR|nr:uncharacterized protein BT62DRAFT_1004754 [Guyanagaster necrorhizus MCA 3950]KAG7447180.1 hypothetical protein BT62DRAFT_1004754 [Guyanagaster necrorhizus MCA 3950]
MSIMAVSRCIAKMSRLKTAAYTSRNVFGLCSNLRGVPFVRFTLSRDPPASFSDEDELRGPVILWNCQSTVPFSVNLCWFVANVDVPRRFRTIPLLPRSIASCHVVLAATPKSYAVVTTKKPRGPVRSQRKQPANTIRAGNGRGSRMTAMLRSSLWHSMREFCRIQDTILL